MTSCAYPGREQVTPCPHVSTNATMHKPMLSTSVLPSKTFNYHVVLSMTGNAVQRLGLEALSIGSGGKSKPQKVALLLQFCIVSKESTEPCAYLQA